MKASALPEEGARASLSPGTGCRGKGQPAREWLNRLYRPLYETARELLRAVRRRGYPARLTFCNLHEVKAGGTYQTEYFPLPEIEVENAAGPCDIGLSLEGTPWLELTLPRQTALRADYEGLTGRYPLEVYGAEDYRTDFFDSGLPLSALRGKLETTREETICLCFYLADPSPQRLEELLELLERQGLLRPPPAENERETGR